MSQSKYVVKDRLGRGAFGTVHLAFKKDNGEKYAIKFVENVDLNVTAAEVEILQKI